MDLLVFAHRGEAMTFLKELPFKSNSTFKDLYQSDTTLLLITKEGSEEVCIKLGYVLGLFPKIERIINYGICGSFNQDLAIESIHCPRTIYMEEEFKSYQCSSDGKLDLITTKKRILEKSESKNLSNFATLVDREAYGVARVAKTFNKKYEVYKIISDHISDAQFCERIKDRAQVFSDKLYDHYMNELNSIKEDQESESRLLADSDFYFSVSQRRIFNNLYNALLKKNNIKTEKDLISILNIEVIKERKDKTPKERTNLLLDNMTSTLYPFRSKVQKSLDQLTSDLRTYDCKFKYDKDLDKKSFKFEAYIDGQEKQEIVVRTLKQFSWEKFSKIMDGDIDV